MRKLFVWVLVFVAGALVGASTIVRLHSRIGKKTGSAPVLPGSDLRKLGQIDSFAVYSSDGVGDETGFAVFRGHKCLVSEFPGETNDTREVTHFENGFSVLVTKTRGSGEIIERLLSIRDDRGHDVFSYVDTNGDGLWDVLLDFSNRKKFVREDWTWVPGGAEGVGPK